MSENTSSFVGREFKILTTTSHRHSGETFTCLDYAYGVIGYKDEDGASWSVRNHEVSWVPQVIPPEKPYVKGDYVVMYDWSVWKVHSVAPDASAALVEDSALKKIWVNIKEIQGKAEDIFPQGMRVEWWPEGNQDQAVVAQITVVSYESNQAGLSVLGEGKVVRFNNLRPIELDERRETPSAVEELFAEALAEAARTMEPTSQVEPEGVWAVYRRYERNMPSSIVSIWKTETEAMQIAAADFDLKAVFRCFGET